VLASWVNRTGGQGYSLEELIEDRAHLDECITDLRNPGQVVVLNVEHKEPSTEKWQQVLECVSAALTALVDREILRSDLTDVQHQVKMTDPDVALPLLQWLRDDGCAAVLNA